MTGNGRNRESETERAIEGHPIIMWHNCKECRNLILAWLSVGKMSYLWAKEVRDL